MNVYLFRGVELPEHLKESIDAYIQTGRPMGGFMAAVIDNDLYGAFRRADDESLAAMNTIVAYLVNRAPSKCWGSKGSHDSWVRYKAAEREMKEAK